MSASRAPLTKENRNEGKREESACAPFPQSLDVPAFQEAWENWLAHRKATRKPVTPQSAKLQLAKCEAWGVEVAVRTINRSIENGWQGLFPSKEDLNRKSAATDNASWSEADIKEQEQLFPE